MIKSKDDQMVDELEKELERYRALKDIIGNELTIKVDELEKELERYRALKDFECNIPDNDLDGCIGDCIKYVNDKFRICIYLKIKDIEGEK